MEVYTVNTFLLNPGQFTLFDVPFSFPDVIM